ncbi:hypothetical protein BU23DRAFT_193181 [Bimuria novae-zelandiae CBS 107.79]|uniref:Uncharacterized protein n=1 Tax=Bimuria novae-zelandiae CBS 107.79 TaxID=1447943 RepID=A0A6A5VR29_9PLEO|nr:hypothetical protein BU23DRAFT_193181 [Bimuria novae-zelandiae CBS 107.79]
MRLIPSLTVWPTTRSSSAQMLREILTPGVITLISAGRTRTTRNSSRLFIMRPLANPASQPSFSAASAQHCGPTCGGYGGRVCPTDSGIWQVHCAECESVRVRGVLGAD